MSKLVASYVPQMAGKKLGVVVKGCDMMGFLELAKRKAINLDNVLMIGVNCGGSVSPVSARKMIKEKYGVDPDTVVKEEIDKGQFIIDRRWKPQGNSIDELGTRASAGAATAAGKVKVRGRRTLLAATGGNW
jgi:formate dehydrogenase subunit beta